MLSDQIQNWITDNGSFSEGFQLYQATGDTRDLNFFSAALKAKFLPPNAKSKLRSRLGEYLLKNPPLPSSAKSIAVQNYRPFSHSTTVEPDQILSLRARGRHLLKQQSHLRARLSEMTESHDKYTDEDRYELAHELMSKVIPNIDDVYDKLRRWSEYGDLPPQATTSSIVQETVKKMLRLSALRSKISRDRARLKKGPSKAEHKELEQGIFEAEKEILQIQTELDLVD